jgi:hypothetical protein
VNGFPLSRLQKQPSQPSFAVQERATWTDKASQLSDMLPSTTAALTRSLLFGPLLSLVPKKRNPLSVLVVVPSHLRNYLTAHVERL